MPRPVLAAVLAGATVIGVPLGLCGGFAARAQMQHGADAPQNPADKAFLGAMRDMMMGMHANMPTGDTDRDFVRMMVPHHQAAVDMAKAELQYGSDEELKTLAKSIIEAQDKELAMMKAWQAKHAR